MFKATRLTLIAGMVALIQACQFVPVQETGYLSSYDGFEKFKGEAIAYPKRGLAKAASADARRQYRSVIIEPVKVTAANLSAKQQQRLSEFLDKELKQNFTANNYRLVTEPGADTLRVRAAVTDVNKSIPLLNIITSIVAPPFDNGGAAGEVELLDSLTGEQVGGIVLADQGAWLKGLFEFATPLGHAQCSLKTLAADSVTLLTASE